MDLSVKKTLVYPFVPAAIRALRAGDMVEISGIVFTARDQVHRLLAGRGRSPVNLRQGAIFHCGPVVVKQGGQWVVRAAGPTTSIRTERYMPEIIRRHRPGLVIGKGGMGPATQAACLKYGCAYLHAVGGAAQAIADHVVKVRAVHFLERFGPTEALWELEVRGLPALVTMDSAGRDLHARVRARSERILKQWLSAK